MNIKLLILSTMLLGCAKSFTMQEPTLEASYHLNYPYCLQELLMPLQKYSPNCAIACQMLVGRDPGFMENYTKIISGSLTSEEKQKMQAEFCRIKCEACKKTMIELTKEL